MNLYASGEDYLEAILVLYKKFGSVRSVDIARHMEVSKPSVCHAVNILKEGFLTIDENHFLYLTSQGKVVAEKIYERHRFFTEELIEAGVDPRQAETDACKMEHVISDQSFPKLKEQKEKNRLLLNLFTAYVVKSVEGKRTTEIQNAISRLVKRQDGSYYRYECLYKKKEHECMNRRKRRSRILNMCKGKLCAS